MDIKQTHPDYAPIEKHIRAARIERVPFIAETIADFVMGVFGELQKPPAPAPILIDRRRESRTGPRRNAIA